MGNFKTGDVVVCMDNTRYTSQVKLGVPKVVRSVSPCGKYLRVFRDDNQEIGGYYAEDFILFQEEQDDPLPPAPESVRYNEGTVGFPFEVKSLLGNNLFPHRIRLGVLCGDRDIAHKYVCVDPDTALQLAHDLRRMAMEIKRKEKQG